jgi:hypothetical protein
VGIALVVIIVPIRILYEMTKDSRERNQRFKDLADRLKEKFGGVEAHRTVFGLSRIHFSHEGRPATVFQPADDEIMIQLEPKIQPNRPSVTGPRLPSEKPPGLGESVTRARLAHTGGGSHLPSPPSPQRDTSAQRGCIRRVTWSPCRV